MKLEELRERVENALEAPPDDPEVPEDSICVAWVLVADWMTPEGERVIRVDASNGLPMWTVNGMLQWATDLECEDDE
jgi:hypothetical protein